MHTVMTDDQWCAANPRPTSPLPATTWREAGPAADPRAKLTAVWTMGATSFRVIAYAVHVESDDLAPDGTFRRAAIGSREAEEIAGNGGRIEFDDRVDSPVEIGTLWTAHGMDGEPETVEIDGRHYAVFASPYCT